MHFLDMDTKSASEQLVPDEAKVFMKIENHLKPIDINKFLIAARVFV